MEKIYVCLTTISTRLGAVHSVVESLLRQTLSQGSYEVRLYLSRDPYLLDDGCPELTPGIRRLLLNHGNTFSVHYVANTGPYRKILPMLLELYEKDNIEFANSLIATCDDDTIYPSDWLEKMYESYTRYSCVVGYRGRCMQFSDGNLEAYKKWRKVIGSNPAHENLLTGKDGILYSPFHLHPAVRNVENAVAIAPKADDLWLKAHALLVGASSYIINETLEHEFPSVDGREPDVSLYRSYNQRGGNDDAVRSINEYLLITFGVSFNQLCTLGPPPLSRLAAQTT